MNETKLTMGSLFDGIGGFLYCGALYGIEPKWASEIVDSAVRVTKRHFPNMKHLGDITKINGAEIDPVDTITAGFPCFPAGTMVLTDKGYVPIENVEVGTMVLTHKGRWRKVIETMVKTSETYKLKGNITIETTAEHPVYGGDIKQSFATLPNGKRSSEKLLVKNIDWISAKHMQEKHWATPNVVEQLPIPEANKESNAQKDMPKMD